MLRLIFAPARAGKTTAVTDESRRLVGEGKSVLWIVPEQASFSSERRLASIGGAAGLASAVSFTRLAQLVVREHGGEAGKRLTEAAAYFLMNLALEEIADELTVYKRHYRSQGFLSQMLGLVDECADAGITPEALARFSAAQPEGLLKEKTAELSLILDAFCAACSRGFVSEKEEMSLAADHIRELGLYSDTHVFIDGFSGFTAPEYKLIDALLSSAESVTVTLVGDGEFPPHAAFAYAADTAARLTRIAGGEAERVILKRKPQKNSLPEAFLNSVRDDIAAQTPEKCKNIRAFISSDPAAETEEVAASIAHLVREEGYRFRDIAVVMRDDTRYKTLLPSALSAADIPFFYDVRAQAQSVVLLQGVMAAVELAAGVRGADPLRLLRSPLIGLDSADIGEVENYCFVWSVRPSEWKCPFTRHPDGVGGYPSREADERLERIEACRQAVWQPVQALALSMKENGGRTFAEGVYGFLSDIDAARHLEEFAACLPEMKGREFLEQQSLLWDRLMEILDLFATVGSDITMEPERISRLLELALSTLQVATPPRTLDEVSVGTADRMRIEDAKAVFLMGAVGGEFPACPMAGGLLNDAERQAMIDSGLTLLGNSDRFLDYERQLVYTAAAAAGEKLIVSAPAAELTGEVLVCSELFSRAAAFSEERKAHRLPKVTNARTGVRCYASIDKNTPEAAALRNVCIKLGREADVLRIESAAERRVHRITSAPLAAKLFGSTMRLSPSRLERYYRCPYSYFAYSGLGVRALQKAELSPAQAGTLVHRVLERVVCAHGGAGLKDIPDDALRREIDSETKAWVGEMFGDISSVESRLMAGFARIGEWLLELLRRLGEEFADSSFSSVAFEMEIGEGKAVEPIRLRTADGAEVFVSGTVDRVDTAVVDGKRYVRVVDYKSGGKQFKLQDVYYGMNMQMLIYLFSIWANGRDELGDTLPAGVLYLPALGEYVPAARDDDEGARLLLQKHYRMNGLLLQDRDVLAAMENGGHALFIPVKPDETKSDALASLAEMGRLRRLIEERITDMAERLHRGGIEVMPCADSDPCRYCDYRGICGFEPGDPVREMAKIDRETILGERGEEDGVLSD